jgi:hypothetical protein
MAKKDKKIKIDNLLGTVKKGKEFWDAHGAELTEAVKKVIPKKGKKVSVSNIMEVVKAGQSAWLGSGKEVVSEAVGLFSAPDTTANEVKVGVLSDDIAENNMVEEDLVEEPEYLPEADPDVDVEEEDTFFEDNLDGLWATVKNTDPKNPEEVMEALSTLAQVSNETVKYVAEQETKREEIRAERDVAIARIHAMSDNIKLYLEKTFDERSAIFAKQFECVDAALREGNTEMLAMTLNSINSLAASSPFKNLADINQVQQALSDGGTEWDI